MKYLLVQYDVNSQLFCYMCRIKTCNVLWLHCRLAYFYVLLFLAIVNYLNGHNEVPSLISGARLYRRLVIIPLPLLSTRNLFAAALKCTVPYWEYLRNTWNYTFVMVVKRHRRNIYILGEKGLATSFLFRFYFCRLISLLLPGVQPCNFLITFL